VSRKFAIEFFGGPIDGHVVELVEPGKAWAAWTDEEGQRHYYALEVRVGGPRYVYRPGAKPTAAPEGG